MTPENTTIPAGYKQTSLGILPEDWEVKELGEVADINPNKPKIELEAEVSFLGMADLSEDGRILNEQTTTYGKVKNGFTYFGHQDVLLAKITPCFENGKGAYLKELRNKDGFGSTEFHTIRAKNEVLPELIYYHTKLETFRGKGELNMVGSAGQKRVPASFIQSFQIPLPPLPEQRAIAEVLSTWDNAITKETALIAALQQRHPAVMERLLCGSVRLPGFTEAWQDVRLGDVGYTYNGLTGKSKDDFGKGKPYITYLNVFSNPKINLDQIGYVSVSEHEKQNAIRYGDFLFTVSSETANEVGMASVVLNSVDDVYLNSFCFGFRPNNFEVILPEFAQFLLRGREVRKAIEILAQGSTRFNISKDGIKNIVLSVPNLPEQTAIAAVLSASEREVVLHRQRLAQLQEQKKGLMQVLLTGKKRLHLD